MHVLVSTHPIRCPFYRPFLVKLSTDKWDSLLCARNIVLQTPHRFEEAARKPSMADFRRASLEFELLAKVNGGFSNLPMVPSAHPNPVIFCLPQKRCVRLLIEVILVVSRGNTSFAESFFLSIKAHQRSPR